MKALCNGCYSSNMDCVLYDGYNTLCPACLTKQIEATKPKPPKCTCPYCSEHNKNYHSPAEEKDIPSIEGETIEG